MIRIGIIGYGYWGPNIVRNVVRIPDVEVSWVCDCNPKVLVEVTRLYPTIQTTQAVHDVFDDQTTDAVIIVTPTSTHFSLALKALKANKHVLVEKPMTQTAKESETLLSYAKKHKNILMVDHTFIYTPAVEKMKEIIAGGILGDILSIDCVRTNLGLIQKDVNVIYDLATHDFAIIDYLLGTSPVTLQANGFNLKDTSQAAVAHITAQYPTTFVHAHVSWLSPVKVRMMTIVGNKKMMLYDDMEQSEKVKIFDKSISIEKDTSTLYQQHVGYRIGTTTAPHIPLEEGLFGVAKAFVKAIKTGKPPITDGKAGYRVVRIIEAATKSLQTTSLCQ